MLLRSTLRRVAQKFTPERERRLTGFTPTPGGGGPHSPTPPTPQTPGERKQQIQTRLEGILQTSTDQRRNLTEAEQIEYNLLLDELDRINAVPPTEPTADQRIRQRVQELLIQPSRNTAEEDELARLQRIEQQRTRDSLRRTFGIGQPGDTPAPSDSANPDAPTPTQEGRANPDAPTSETNSEEEYYDGNHLEKLRSRLSAFKAKILMIQSKMKKLDDIAKKFMKKEDYEKWQANGAYFAQDEKQARQWDRNTTAMSVTLVAIAGWENFVELLGKWKSREMKPVEFINHFESFGRDQSFTREEQENWEDMIDKSRSVLAGRGDWDDLDQTVQNEIIHGIDGIIQPDKFLEDITSHQEAYQGGLDTWIEQLPAIEKELEIRGVKKGSAKWVIQLMSAKDIWNGMKFVWEAFVQTYKQSAAIREARVAKGIAGVVTPLTNNIEWFRGADQILDSNLERKNNEEKNQFVEFLKSKQITCRQLFQPGGFMDQNKSSPNRALAVLEYAASRGFLYDLKKSGNANVNAIMLFGKWRAVDVVPRHWTETEIVNYFSNLSSTNESGADSEKNSAARREHTTDNIPDFIKAIKGELHDMNFWAASGIMNRALERGLRGETSPWLATTLLSVLKDEKDPMARQFIEQTVIDAIGTKSFYHGAFTLGAFKKYRREIMAWADDEEGIIDLEDITPFTKAIVIIERDIQKHASKKLEQEELDLIVAKVLAGQVVNVGNWSISIFEDRFKDYRGDIVQEEVKFEELDSDYFSNISEVVSLSHQSIFEQTFQMSNERVLHKDKANGLLTSVIKLDAEIEKGGNEEAIKNYRESMQEKFAYTLQSGSMNSSRATPWRHNEILTPEGKTAVAFVELMRRNLLDPHVLISLIISNGGVKVQRGATQVLFIPWLQDLNKSNPKIIINLRTRYQDWIVNGKNGNRNDRDYQGHLDVLEEIFSGNSPSRAPQPQQTPPRRSPRTSNPQQSA